MVTTTADVYFTTQLRDRCWDYSILIKHEETWDSVNCSIPIHHTHAHNLTDLSWDQQWRESLEEVKKGLLAPEEVEKGLPAPEEVERELGNRENDE